VNRCTKFEANPIYPCSVSGKTRIMSSLRRFAVRRRLVQRAAPHDTEVDVRQQVAQVDGDEMKPWTDQNLAVPGTRRFHDAVGHVFRTHSSFYLLLSHYHTTSMSIRVVNPRKHFYSQQAGQF